MRGKLFSLWGSHNTYQRMGVFFQVNSEVIRMVGSKCFCFGLAKDISVLVVFLWNGGEVDFLGDSSRFGLYCRTELEGKCF